MSYGKRYITQEEYSSLLSSQGGKCSICGCVLIRGYVDHNHETDTLRSVLCNRCNIGLHYIEDAAFMKNASIYLERYR